MAEKILGPINQEGKATTVRELHRKKTAERRHDDQASFAETVTTEHATIQRAFSYALSTPEKGCVWERIQ